jgi:predicted glycosyltransferase
MKTLRIVNYAVNGGGVGHLVRLVAVSRWLRRYAAHAGVRAEIYFLTSSEADGLLFHERFASFKLPSKTVVGDAGIDKIAYLALAKQWVWHSLGLLRPDLLVVDTFPRGSFGELLSALDLAAHRAFIYRPMKDSFAARADFQAMLPVYDAIFVPESQADAPVRVPPEAAAKVRWTGPVVARERAELVPRADARARLGVPDGRLAVYVSAGGGGDPAAEAQLAEVHAALGGEPDLHLVVGAGPLYRGRLLAGERVTWLAQPGAGELMAAYDLAVCAAGYNTFGELMHAGVPAVFLPQDKIADEQDVRAARAVRAGAAAAAGGAAAIRAAVTRWRDPEARAAAAAAARALVPINHARTLAGELLRLCLPAAAVDAAEDAVDDAVLAAARATGFDVSDFIDMMHLCGGEGAGALRWAAERGVPAAAAIRAASAFVRKLSAASPVDRDGRGRAARVVLEALAPFGDWPGAIALLKVYAPERDVGAERLAADLAQFLDGLRARGEDLYRGIAALAAAGEPRKAEG